MMLVSDPHLFQERFPAIRVNFIPRKTGRTEGCDGFAAPIPNTDRRSFPTMIPAGAQCILEVIGRTVHSYALRREP